MDGKDENGVEELDVDAAGVCDGVAAAGAGCGMLCGLPSAPSTPCFVLESPPSCPFLFSHAISSGSLSSAQPISTSCKPLSARPLAHTAANAPPICLNGTRAMTRFGFFGGAGLRMSLIDASSTAPNGARSVARLAGVVSDGCVDSGYLRRIVVSKSPTIRHKPPSSLASSLATFMHTHLTQAAHPRGPISMPPPPSSSAPFPSPPSVSAPPP